MSPTKLLILAAALLGLLVAPSVGAEEEIDKCQSLTAQWTKAGPEESRR